MSSRNLRSPANARRAVTGWQRVRRWRSPVIAVFSLIVLIGAAIWRWDVDPAELWGYLLVIVIGLLLIVALAFGAGLLLRWLRRER